MRKRKIAILGMAPSTRGEAPVQGGDWERWGMAHDVERYTFDRAFEIHEQTMWKRYAGGDDYFDKLEAIEAPLFMQHTHEELPNSKRYPFEEVKKIVLEPPQSSLAYMIGLAILECADVIGLWGVDMRYGIEYRKQRANMRYLIGLARGRGSDVIVPPECALLDGDEVYGVELLHENMMSAHIWREQYMRWCDGPSYKAVAAE